MTLPLSLAKRIDELNSRIEQAQDELKRLRTIYSKFPNLQVETDKWGLGRYYSKDANAIVNDVDIQYSCGAVIARPLIVVNGFNIFSDPPSFLIGIDGGWYREYDFDINWEHNFIFHGISPIVVEKVREYVKKFCHEDDVVDSENPSD